MINDACVAATGGYNASIWYTQLILALQVILHLIYFTVLTDLASM